MSIEWNERQIRILREFYPTEGVEGVRRRIGEGVTRSAVVGKARREGVKHIAQPGRPGGNLLNMTPELLERRAVKLREVNAARAREREYAKTLGISTYRIANRVATALAQSNRKAEPPPKVAMPIAMLPIPPASTCQWPLTNGRPWSFCGNGSTTGSSYCHAHKRASTINLRADAPVAQAAE